MNMTTTPDILVIEDDPIMREALADWLQAAGYRVRTVPDGSAGLAAVRLTSALYGVGAVVADLDPTKRQAALDAGAASAVDPADPEIRDRLLRETGGFATAIDFVGGETSAGLGLALLRKGGRIFVVGLYGGSIEIPLFTLPSRAVGHSAACRYRGNHRHRVADAIPSGGIGITQI